MATKRSIPTNLFASPDFFELSSNTTRLILVGIILDADDEGRGSAHPRLLARKLDQAQEDIVRALEELTAHGMLLCYEVAGRRYYWLCHWQKYQTLSKPTPSLYPAPPDIFQAEQKMPRETQKNPGDSRETPSEGEGKGKKKRTEREENRSEAEGNLPAVITRFPTATCNSASSSASSSKTLEEMTEQIASLLKLSASQELREVVQEFLPVTTLSLVGEAIEAHAWIANAQRNHTQQPMTPAFFRRWLRRAQQGSQLSTRPGPAEREKSRPQAQRSSSDQDQYAAYVNQLIEQYNGPEALRRVV
jgi:hypothetical protein